MVLWCVGNVLMGMMMWFGLCVLLGMLSYMMLRCLVNGGGVNVEKCVVCVLLSVGVIVLCVGCGVF